VVVKNKFSCKNLLKNQVTEDFAFPRSFVSDQLLILLGYN